MMKINNTKKIKKDKTYLDRKCKDEAKTHR